MTPADKIRQFIRERREIANGPTIVPGKWDNLDDLTKDEEARLIDAQNTDETKLDLIERLLDCIEELSDFTSCHLENIQHYFENKCIPTAEEVNQCAIADSEIRYALAKCAKIIEENGK